MANIITRRSRGRVDAEAHAIQTQSPEPLPPAMAEKIAAQHVREHRDLESGKHQEVIAREQESQAKRSKEVTMQPGWSEEALRKIHPSKKRGR